MQVTGSKADTDSIRVLRDYLSEQQLAEELTIARKTLHRWHREGRGPSRTKLGKRVFYSRSAVEEWLSSREQPRARGAKRSRAINL